MDIVTTNDVPGATADPKVPLTDRHPPLEWIGERFALLIDALRDMADDVVPQLEAIDTSRLSPDALAAVDSLSPQRRARLRHVVTQMFADPEDNDDDERIRQEEINTAFRDAFQGDVHLISTFMEGVATAHAGPDRVSIMRNSLLLQAVAGFEVLIAGVATRFFLHNPKSLESNEREFSLAEVRTFEDVDDALDVLIARRVTKLMRCELDDWVKWIRDHAKANMEKASINWPATREGFQRRHVMIHNGGLVSRQYLAKVESGASVGDRLRVDDAYLHRLFDDLDVISVAVILAARSTWLPEEVDIACSSLVRRTYSLLRRERWAAVAKLAELRPLLKGLASSKEALRANGLFARMQLDGATAIRDEVMAWDVSASAGRFALVRLVLLEDFQAALNVIPGMIERDELTSGELQTWPILRPIRTHPDWDALALEVGISQDRPTQAE
jgi:hypothetical protein